MIGGDNAGLPNGRRLIDDTVDIYLRWPAGSWFPPAQGGKQLPLGDGVDVNDKSFLSSFPYAASPHIRLRLAISRRTSRRTRRPPGSPPLVP